MRLINVSDPTNPREIGSWSTSNFAYGVAVIGSYAYVADGLGGLRIINVANPASPIEVGSYDTPGRAESVTVVGRYAYVADGYNGLQVINVVNPVNPSYVGSYDSIHYAVGIAVAGVNTYLADRDGGLIVLHNAFLTSYRTFLPSLDAFLPYMRYEPNNSIQQSWGSLLSGVEYQAFMHNEQDDTDYYYFDVLAEDGIEVWLDQIPNGNDYDLYLYNSRSERIGFSGQLGNRSEHIRVNGVAPLGRYYIRVQRELGSSATQPYKLRVGYGTAGTWSDSFDVYPTGSSMHGLGGWRGWDNLPAATAYTSDTFRRSSPNSVKIEGRSDLVHLYVDRTDGVWLLSAWQYIPANFNGISYFILMNQYGDGSGDPRSWSTEVKFDGNLNQVANRGASGGTLAMVKGQWIEIKVEIYLGRNLQKFYYDNRLLYQGSWTDEVTSGGIANIAAVDLWANNASALYYDNMSLASIHTVTDDGSDYQVDANIESVSSIEIVPTPH